MNWIVICFFPNTSNNKGILNLLSYTAKNTLRKLQKIKTLILYNLLTNALTEILPKLMILKIIFSKIFGLARIMIF